MLLGTQTVAVFLRLGGPQGKDTATLCVPSTEPNQPHTHRHSMVTGPSRPLAQVTILQQYYCVTIASGVPVQQVGCDSSVSLGLLLGTQALLFSLPRFCTWPTYSNSLAAQLSKMSSQPHTPFPRAPSMVGCFACVFTHTHTKPTGPSQPPAVTQVSKA